jgi:tellurium resistance protein TerZ
VSISLSGSGPHNAQIIATVARGEGEGWTMTAIGAVAPGRSFQEPLPVTAGHL